MLLRVSDPPDGKPASTAAATRVPFAALTVCPQGTASLVCPTVYPSKASTARSIRIPPPQRPALECLLVSAQTSEGVPERIWTRTLQKKVARHVQMPRRAQSGVAGNQHPTFSLENSSFEWTRRKAEGAGLSQQGERRRKGTKLVTHWRGLGPMMAYNFCQVQHAKPLGQGSGALVNPCKGKDFSDVLTIAIPPIDVWH